MPVTRVSTIDNARNYYVIGFVSEKTFWDFYDMFDFLEKNAYLIDKRSLLDFWMTDKFTLSKLKKIDSRFISGNKVTSILFILIECRIHFLVKHVSDFRFTWSRLSDSTRQTNRSLSILHCLTPFIPWSTVSNTNQQLQLRILAILRVQCEHKLNHRVALNPSCPFQYSSRPLLLH